MGNLKMKCTEEKMMNDLIELYTYYFKRAAEEDRKAARNENQIYEIGKNDGAVEALGAIMLQVFGGKAMYEIWKKTMEWVNDKQSDN